eukprot:517552-Amphidinium_carterae.1
MSDDDERQGHKDDEEDDTGLDMFQNHFGCRIDSSWCEVSTGGLRQHSAILIQSGAVDTAGHVKKACLASQFQNYSKLAWRKPFK